VALRIIFLWPLSLPWHNSFFSFIVVKPFGIAVKKALKNKVETCICAVWLAHLSYMAGWVRLGITRSLACTEPQCLYKGCTLPVPYFLRDNSIMAQMNCICRLEVFAVDSLLEIKSMLHVKDVRKLKQITVWMWVLILIALSDEALHAISYRNNQQDATV
jgi:hypothetical protein